jgi:hypothetical protein
LLAPLVTATISLVTKSIALLPLFSFRPDCADQTSAMSMIASAIRAELPEANCARYPLDEPERVFA